MPSKPPRVNAKRLTPAPRAWAISQRRTRQERGYGREHERMRARVLDEEPLCRACLRRDVMTRATIADHIKPKAEGGGDERENYQGLCAACHTAKTARESGRARRGRGGG